eukprot:scaffold3551_cov408-Prasinococcus_capsulatus_cf.AAC.22
MAFPDMPFPPASRRDSCMWSSMRSPSSEYSWGVGTPRTMPFSSCRASAERIMSATSSGESTRIGDLHPLCALKNAGNSSVPKAATVTPCVSRYSSVLGMSRIDFTPAHTTHMEVLDGTQTLHRRTSLVPSSIPHDVPAQLRQVC